MSKEVSSKLTGNLIAVHQTAAAVAAAAAFERGRNRKKRFKRVFKSNLIGQVGEHGGSRQAGRQSVSQTDTYLFYFP